MRIIWKNVGTAILLLLLTKNLHAVDSKASKGTTTAKPATVTPSNPVTNGPSATTMTPSNPVTNGPPATTMTPSNPVTDGSPATTMTPSNPVTNGPPATTMTPAVVTPPSSKVILDNLAASKILQKINDTFIRPIIGNGTVLEIVDRFVPDNVLGVPELPPIADAASQKNLVAAAPFLNSLTKLLPGLKKLPGFNGEQLRSINSVVSDDPELNAAMEQFTAPLVRAARRNGQATAADLEQFLNSIPNLVVKIPGWDKAFDINELNPVFLKNLVNGKGIPGIPSEATAPVIKAFTERMVEAAQAALEDRLTEDQKKYLLRLDKIPAELIGKVMQGGNVFGMTPEQTKTLKAYYTEKASKGNALGDMLSILPPNYNLSSLSKEVIQAAMKGEFPDMNKLPKDLQEHIKKNFENVLAAFAKSGSNGNASFDELLKKMPNFERPELTTFNPYDLSVVGPELRHKESEEQKAKQIRLYTIIAFAIIIVVTIAVLTFLYFHMKRRIPNHTSCSRGSPPMPLLKKGGNKLFSSTKITNHLE